MAIPEAQLTELAKHFPEAELHEEGGYTYLAIPALPLPEGCKPEKTDALLCPQMKDGYHSRLYFSDQIQPRTQRHLNWTVQGHMILGKKRWAISWQSAPGLTLMQMLGVHLKAFA